MSSRKALGGWCDVLLLVVRWHLRSATAADVRRPDPLLCLSLCVDAAYRPKSKREKLLQDAIQVLYEQQTKSPEMPMAAVSGGKDDDDKEEYTPWVLLKFSPFLST